MSLSPSHQFVTWFRSVAPWVYAFRGKTFIISCGGEIVESSLFDLFIQDINLLVSLGIRVVLICGSRPQIDARMAGRGLVPHFHQGIRVTDTLALECVREAIGEMRIEFEQRFSFGLPNTPMARSEGVRVISGSFLTAQPIGIIDGVDYQFSGRVRSVDAQTIHHALDNGDIVLLGNIGYSPSGEAFNLTTEDVAASVAQSLSAEKLIFLTETEGVPSKRSLKTKPPSSAPKNKTELSARSSYERELTIAQTKEWLKGIKRESDISLPLSHLIRTIESAVLAAEGGVPRIHLISRHTDGSLLLELLSDQGIGTMITATGLEMVRLATINDVGGILKLIEPMENDGTLVRRGREKIETEITQFVVLEHDGVIAGCAALYPFLPEKAAEMACFVVSPAYRGRGYGARLLAFVQAEARRMRIKRLFVLTTRTAHWFIEHGFKEAHLDQLPKARKNLYNYQRQSKIFIQALK